MSRKRRKVSPPRPRLGPGEANGVTALYSKPRAAFLLGVHSRDLCSATIECCLQSLCDEIQPVNRLVSLQRTLDQIYQSYKEFAERKERDFATAEDLWHLISARRWTPDRQHLDALKTLADHALAEENPFYECYQLGSVLGECLASAMRDGNDIRLIQRALAAAQRLPSRFLNRFKSFKRLNRAVMQTTSIEGLFSELADLRAGNAGLVELIHLISQNTEREVENLRRSKLPASGAIESRYRTKPLSYKEAAPLMRNFGTARQRVRWLRESVRRGEIRCEHLSRQTHYFDVRNFLEESKPLVRPS
jgi:hypothetical protein